MDDFTPPICYRCGGTLAGIIGEVDLICVKCSTKFEIKEVE